MSDRMICKICGINKTNNPDDICINCKTAIISNEDFPPDT